MTYNGDMLGIIFHLLLTFGVLWYQRKQKFKTRLWVLSAIWYAVSAMLVYIESSLATGSILPPLFLQGLLISLFYVPAVYFAAHWARRHKSGPWSAFALFLAFSIISTVAAGLFLARAESVQGLNFSSS